MDKPIRSYLRDYLKLWWARLDDKVVNDAGSFVSSVFAAVAMAICSPLILLGYMICDTIIAILIMCVIIYMFSTELRSTAGRIFIQDVLMKDKAFNDDRRQYNVDDFTGIKNMAKTFKEICHDTFIITKYIYTRGQIKTKY